MTMIPIALIILAFLALIVVEANPITGIVLGGLLGIAWYLFSRVSHLDTTIAELRHNLLLIKDRLAKYESRSDQHASGMAPSADHTDTVARHVKSPAPQPVQTSSFTTRASADDSTEQAAHVTPPAPAAIPEPVNQATGQRATAAAPAKPAEPAAPTLFDKALKAALNWFTDGNTFVRIGIIILFMGMTFLIRYAIDNDLLPIEIRLAAVAAAGIALLYWGWRQRNIRHMFSLLIQGGGIGLLYLTIFAGFSLYHVIPSGLAFVFLALIVILAALLSIYQDAKPLALFAAIGGFLAPVLTSSGSNNYIGLFSYYTILNLGIFYVAWFKSWRIVNFVGFVFTFAISTAWGVLSYRPEYFPTTEPFLIIFFLMYTAIGILFARQRTEFYKDYVDSSLIFGTPLLAFGLQSAMVKNYEYGIAISAFVLAAFYLLLAGYMWRRYQSRLRLLAESFLSLGVIFATLAIPFAIDGTLTGATWAIEGAGILWISIKQQQKYRRLFGLALIFAASAMLLYELFFPLFQPGPIFDYAFANSVFIGCVIIFLSASVASWLLSNDYPGKFAIEKQLALPLVIYGLIVLYGGFEYQIIDFSLYAPHGMLLAILAGLCVLAFAIAGDKLAWNLARQTSLAMLVPLAIAAVLSYAYQTQLAENYGYLVWTLAALIYFYSLKKSLHNIPDKPLIIAHTGITVIISGLLFWDGIWQLLLCYSLLAIAFNHIGNRWSWPQLKTLALGFLPILVICSAAAITIDGNLIDLSSISTHITWPFPPGYVLWPSGFIVYFYLLRQNPRIGKYSTRNLHFAGVALIYALLLWLGPWPLLLGAILLGTTYCLLWLRYSWQEMYYSSMALLPIMWLTLLTSLIENSAHPFYLQDYNLNLSTSMELGYLLWPLALISLFWSLRQYDHQKQPAISVFQSLAILLPVLLLTWETSWHLLDYFEFMSAWHLAWLPILSLLAITFIMKSGFWPFSDHAEKYRLLALPVLGVALFSWSILQLAAPANGAPLFWIPILNPLDLVQLIIIMAVLLWKEQILAITGDPSDRHYFYIMVMAYIFLWMNVDVLRAVHHWAAIPWQLPDILNANISQASLSLFWALSGLATTLYSSRKQNRTLWIIGATLLGIVVLKLFVIDFSARETIERIVTFTGVGLLLMLVGYFSPLPPRKKLTTGNN